MAEILEKNAAPTDTGVRLDRFLSDSFSITRAAAERYLAEGAVTVTGGKAEKNYRLRGNEQITLTVPDPTPAEAVPENIPLDVVFEDEDIIVINKPQGMVVHPAAGNESGTLVNALLYHCNGSLSGVGGVTRPGIVHRIDKDTSGLIAVAKNDAAHLALSAQLKDHSMHRVYHALTIGNLREDSGTVNAPIARHPRDRKRMAVQKDGKEAITHYRVLERFSGLCHLECRLETGRTHQIRVHMAHLGHPLLGDPVYGGENQRFVAQHRALFHGQCLHAGKLCLVHPTTGAAMCFETPLPADFEKILSILRKEQG